MALLKFNALLSHPKIAFCRCLCVAGVILLASSFASASKTELVEDNLPNIEDLLSELELSHLANNFYASGFTETKYIMRMKDMDMRIMAMEWGVDKEAINRVKEAIINYKVEREVVTFEEDPLLAVRNSLAYGKLVVRRATTSYEFYTGFGSAAMPRDWLPIVAASDGTACTPSNEDIAGRIVLASRGGCSFMDKARNASTAGVLAIINNSSDLFQIATGYGSGKKGSGDDMSVDLPMVIQERRTCCHVPILQFICF